MTAKVVSDFSRRDNPSRGSVEVYEQRLSAKRSLSLIARPRRLKSLLSNTFQNIEEKGEASLRKRLSRGSTCALAGCVCVALDAAVWRGGSWHSRYAGTCARFRLSMFRRGRRNQPATVFFAPTLHPFFNTLQCVTRKPQSTALCASDHSTYPKAGGDAVALRPRRPTNTRDSLR